MAVVMFVTSVPAMVDAREHMEYPREQEELDYYVVDGQKYVDDENKTYRYLTMEDFEPIEDAELLAMLGAEEYNRSTTYSNTPYLPTSPTYEHDLAESDYVGSVDLSNGDQWSPLLKRNIQKRYTNICVDAIFNKTVSMGFFWYSAIEEKWYGTSVTDMKFNIIVNAYQIQHSTVGDGAQIIRILFFDFDNSTQKFDYAIKDTNIAMY